METKRLMRSFIKIAMTAFLVFSTGNAFAIDNTTRVISPYWQVDTGSYTFIAVSHSSLSGMNSQIGVKVSILDSGGSSYGTAQSFTVSQGGTQRVFIVPTTHATLNPTSVTDSDVTFIRGTSNYTYGSIVVSPVATNPFEKWREGVSGANGNNEGMRDATMLTYWGSVVVEANTTGFAMEFIGDMNDSGGGINTCESVLSIIRCVNSGVNLQ